MGIRPLHDRVMVEPLTAEEKTAGGIIIPDTAQEKPQEGKVVAVGKGKLLSDGKTKPLDVKKGDVVVFNKYGGMELSLGDGEYIFLKQDEVLGIIE